MCHSAIALGTLSGGWRFVKTMGQKITRLRPVDGFCAESGSAIFRCLSLRLGRAREHDAYHYRRYRRCGFSAPSFQRTLGRSQPHCVGLVCNHSRGGGHSRGGLLAQSNDIRITDHLTENPVCKDGVFVSADPKRNGSGFAIMYIWDWKN